MKIGKRFSAETRRYRRSIKSSSEGEQIWKQMRKSPHKIYVHYASSSSNKKMSEYLGRVGEGEAMTGNKYNSIMSMDYMDIDAGKDPDYNFKYLSWYSFNYH